MGLNLDISKLELRVFKTLGAQTVFNLTIKTRPLIFTIHLHVELVDGVCVTCARSVPRRIIADAPDSTHQGEVEKMLLRCAHEIKTKTQGPKDKLP